MKCVALQENLQEALGYLQKAIPSKPQLPILSSILLTITESECTLAATDLYMGVRSTIPVSSDMAGEIVVPGKQFKEIITSLSPGEIIIAYADNTLTLTSGKTTTTLQCYPSDEYPAFPRVEGREFSLSADKLQLLQQYVAFSASTDQTRPVLTTVLFEFLDNSLQFVATDGFRLALLAVEHRDDSVVGEKLLIPSRALLEVYRILSHKQLQTLAFTISEELKQILFTVGDVEVFVRFIEGEYPPYDKIIPSVFTTQVIFDRQELIEQIKRALIFARESSNITQFAFSEGEAKVLAASPSLGSFEGILSTASVEGESASIAFNSKYLLDFLNTLSVEQVWFGMSDSLKPALFRIEGFESFQYVVMPFKVNR